MQSDFDPAKFYKSYPLKVISRPGYPTRAQYKSTLLWELYGHRIMNSLEGKIINYADIGGCFGFGANAMAFQIFKSQGEYPKTKVFEISKYFIEIGRQLFPYIEFVQKNLAEPNNSAKEIFDLITLFDVIEHISHPEVFLLEMAKHSKYALLLTPTETSGDWFGAKPPSKQGNLHEDGHVNFFTPKSYIELLKKSGWELKYGKSIKTLANNNTEKKILYPEDPLFQKKLKLRSRLIIKSLNSRIVPYSICRKIFGGGFHIGLAESLKFEH